MQYSGHLAPLFPSGGEELPGKEPRAPEAILGALNEAWALVPPLFLGETLSGRPAPSATWVKVAQSVEGLHLLAFSPDPLHSGGALSLLVDPIGDLEGYFEIGVAAEGHLQSAVLRRSRSGHKRNALWTCPGAKGELLNHEGGFWSIELFIPPLDVAERHPALGEVWQLNVQRTHSDGTRTFLERLPRFRKAVF